MTLKPELVDLFDLEGRVALVTGASQGLGRRFALTLAKAGATLALAARGADRLAAVAAEARALGGRVETFAVDVRDKARVDETAAAVAGSLGPIRVLVNNSGIAVTRRLLEVTEQDWRDVVDTNLTGAWFVGQAVARHMAEHGQGGSIVNVSSLLGHRTTPGVIGYNAAKAGLDHITRQMAADLARHRVRVNALAPGYIETEMNRDYFRSDQGKALIARIPERRLGQEGDLDGPLLFLASDASRYVTGQVLGVDGGHSVGYI